RRRHRPAAARTAPPAGPLVGVVVLEVGRRIQGPLAAHLLWQLGAEVVRIEPPGGDPMRGAPPLCGEQAAVWLAFNHGKSAVEIDLKRASGRRELIGLVRDADVLLHNWAPATALRLGLESASLHRVNPTLVHAHTSGWSDAVPDPPLATDYMVQAHSGLADALRADPAEPPRPTLLTVLDSLGGMLGAEAAVAGLLHRRLTGRGSAVESSLLSAARLLRDPPPRRHRPDPVPVGEGRWATAPGAGPGEAAAAPVTTSLRPDRLPAVLAAVTTTTAGGCVLPPRPWSSAAEPADP
ncbi:CoA transferase, partial [Streptomyces spiramenti]